MSMWHEDDRAPGFVRAISDAMGPTYRGVPVPPEHRIQFGRDLKEALAWREGVDAAMTTFGEEVNMANERGKSESAARMGPTTEADVEKALARAKAARKEADRKAAEEAQEGQS